MEIDMPEEGWGLVVQEYFCRFCGPKRGTSYYQHPQLRAASSTEKEQWAEDKHLNYRHTYKNGVWIRRRPYRWYAEHWPLRPLDTGWRWLWYWRHALKRRKSS